MLYAIPNLSASRTVECEPWEATTTAPPKNQWNNPDLNHTFYSGYEGLMVSVRIDSKNNPAIKLHWIVVDYDAQIDEHERATFLEKCEDFRPQYICRTSSGGARLLWKLAEPFPLHNNDLTQKLMHHVRRKLRLAKLLPGLDGGALEDPCKYYEAGTDWKKLSEDEIPAAYMMQWSIESSKSYAWHRRPSGAGERSEAVLPLHFPALSRPIVSSALCFFLLLTEECYALKHLGSATSYFICSFPGPFDFPSLSREMFSMFIKEPLPFNLH